jgi:phage terminase large subunit-like protein
MTCHLTGLYPEWWVGRRYNRPVELLAAGDTSQTTRDIIQFGLCGPTHDFGTGMLPKDLIVDTRPKRNIPDAYELIHVRHVSGGTSTIQLKSYDQGRQIFQGQVFDGVFLDEEVSQDVYSEALIRTMTSGGFTVLTFTPLSGLTDLVLSFIESDQFSDSQYPKFVTNCTWWDVPHLKPEEIDQMLAATPPQLREARSKGIPTAGSGRIYPIDINNVTVADFQIPKFWQKAYALDVGWQATAAIFGAWDKENDVVYLYSEHKQGEAEPVIHAKAIKSRG